MSIKFTFVKTKMLVFLAALIMGFSGGVIRSGQIESYAADEESESTGGQRAFLACFIDDASCTYKTTVLYSGDELERMWITRHFFTSDAGFNFTSDAGFNVNVQGNGRISLLQMGSSPADIKISPEGYFLDISSNGWIISKDSENLVEQAQSNILKNCSAPLSFPFKYAGKTADLNRAAAVEAAIGDDFRNALLFVNDGKGYDDVDALVQTSFYLVTAAEGSYIYNQFYTEGESEPYIVHFLDTADGGLTYKMRISHYNRDTGMDEYQDFTWKVKKGYANCEYGQIMEDGTPNKVVRKNLIGMLLNESAETSDTEYITWEHLYYTAGIFYSSGIAYSNYSEVYPTSALEGGLVEVVGNLLNGVKSILQTYSIEECIFNSGIRGTNAFSFGVYPRDWNARFGPVYLIFVAIALSLVTLSLVIIILKKQYSTVSPSVRASMLDGIKDLLISVLLVSFAWYFCKFILYANYQFVAIWNSARNGKVIVSQVGYSTLAAVLYAFVHFALTIYINFLYILRAVSVPALMVTAPVFIIASSFGEKGKKITGLWLKEFLGLVLLQSVHSFVYGFILMCSTGLRGIESIVICFSVIPLTNLFRNITGTGGEAIIRTAKGLTGTAVAAGGAAAAGAARVVGTGVSLAGKTAGGVAGGIAAKAGGLSFGSGFSAGSKIGGVISAPVSAAARGSGGLTQAGIGLGASVALGDGTGDGQIDRGLGQAVGSVDKLEHTFDDAARHFGGTMTSRTTSGRTPNTHNGTAERQNTGRNMERQTGKTNGEAPATTRRAGNERLYQPRTNTGAYTNPSSHKNAVQTRMANVKFTPPPTAGQGFEMVEPAD